jgi:hypothetical protein
MRSAGELALAHTELRTRGKTADFALKLLDSRTLDGRIQELIHRLSLH